VASFLQFLTRLLIVMNSQQFSSLSESGFIPTTPRVSNTLLGGHPRSHLFQRVASFLLVSKKGGVYMDGIVFSSLSESGFIPTQRNVRKI